MKKILFIDRDGVLIKEPHDEQIDRIEKLVFVKGVFTYLAKIAKELDYTFVMVTNQDGLGTDNYPESTFWPIQNLIVRTLKGEGILFDEIYIDRSFSKDNSPNRKPGIGMLTKYLEPTYDLAHSYVIGDRWSDMQLAKNLGARGIYFNAFDTNKSGSWSDAVAHRAASWSEVYTYLNALDRKSSIARTTKETQIAISINLDGNGISQISTGLHFFDHMLEQISKHADVDLFIDTKGDLQIDDHHAIEDTGIALGSAVRRALAKKIGINRYGFSLPMDDCKSTVLLDFGGRPWLEWDVRFRREKIGDVSTEMFFHFFKSFCDAAQCNLNISASGSNEHHKIESIFKAFAKAVKQAKYRDVNSVSLPSTKGIL